MCCKWFQRYCKNISKVPEKLRQIETLEEEWCENGIKWSDNLQNEDGEICINIQICTCNACIDMKNENELTTGHRNDNKTVRRRLIT